MLKYFLFTFLPLHLTLYDYNKCTLYPGEVFSLSLHISLPCCVSGAAFTYHFKLIGKDLTTLDRNVVYSKRVFKRTNFLNAFREVSTITSQLMVTNVNN